MNGKSMALELGRARDASLCSFLVFSTTFFGLNRSLASRRMGSLIRPLLSINRNDVKKLCRFWGLPIYPDVTNQTVAFSRNRIRKQLLPALRVALNPQVDSVLSQSAEIMLAERLQQDLLALKLLRAYHYVPRFERVGGLHCLQSSNARPHSPGEEEGNQAKWRFRIMERQLGQWSTGALIGHIKPRLPWDGVRWDGARWDGPRRGPQPVHCKQCKTIEGERAPQLVHCKQCKAIEGDGVLQPVEQNAEPLGDLRGLWVPWNGEGAPQPPEEPKRSLTSIDMSVVRAARADYGPTLAVKSRDLQAVWFGFGKTGAILGAKDSCHRQKQCIRLLHKRRGCLFLPQVGIFFTNSISPPSPRTPCQCYSKFFK
uniref:Hypothetical chloroplast RF62 n=1 Tax=Paradoxia multiseta TaxID=249350 RepID=A0A097KP85_9CHLO|nr:hypothetical chloroplast RF62 [Paradoxia multiseta]AIT94975.1 hypothetical chloroplast RF62 [Paradoxia multiseta]